jgi:hypothetical protein
VNSKTSLIKRILIVSSLIGEFAVPHRSNHGADTHSSFRSGVHSTASGNQPPTPPHTPKMIVGTPVNNGHPSIAQAGN